MIGICLLQCELFPLHLCRHVMKFILGRAISWYDVAFFDPQLFESLRSLVHHESGQSPAAVLGDLQLTFAINLPVEEVR
jgi:E3 ubiquitin-protein ligase EDD1